MVMKEIKLTQGKTAMVDDQDFEWLSQWKWLAVYSGSNKWYARRNYRDNGKRYSIFMHRQILNAPEGMQGDFIDGDSLNNQRSNLRLATQSQNNMNRESFKKNKTSKYKGVCFYNRPKKYGMQIYFGGKVISRLFNTEIEAAKEYDRLARIHHKEFARLNFP